LVDVQRAEELVIDVTGPAAGGDVTHDELPGDDVTLVHVSDVRSLLLVSRGDDVDDDDDAMVSAQLPVVVYLRRDDVDATLHSELVLLQLVPSVDSLQHNEACRLGSTSPAITGTFSVRQHRDVTSVTLTDSQSARRAMTHRQRYQLSVICEPLHGHAHPFTVYLHVQII